MRVPYYLSTRIPTDKARVVLDKEGNAIFQGYSEYRFEVLVPKSLVNNQTAGRIVQYGHGLFGNFGEMESGYLQQMAYDYGYVLCGADWVGMASQNVPDVVDVMLRDMNDLMAIPDISSQGFINQISLMRLMIGDLSKDPELTYSFGPVIDPSKRNYFGNSEGGIYGMVYLALSTDIINGVLGVPGGPYGLLLPRSHDFNLYFDMIKQRYFDPVDRINLVQYVQLLWDRAEPSGFMDCISKDPLPNTPSHNALMHNALGDAQVTWLGAQAMARSIGSSMFVSNPPEGNETFYGFNMISDDTIIENGNVIVTFNFDAPQVPFVNLPANTDTDTHEYPRRDPRAMEMLNIFFTTGQIVNTCGGTCFVDDF